MTPDLAALLADPARALDVPIGEVPALLAALIPDLADDEFELLLVTRLRDGQRRFGYFDLPRDRRDFHREALEEVADALVYSGVVLVRRRRRALLRRHGHREGMRG